MFNTALRVVRPIALRAARPVQPSAFCALSTTAVRRSGPAPPQLFGTGATAGEIPTDEQQATGLERFQLLGEMEGYEAFDLGPLDSSRVGTLEDPIKVYSLDTVRIVGCTGSPAESHELHWFTLPQHKNRRCPECGSVYTLDYHGPDQHDAHHH
ncbi:cytochrome c oxidase polypeptide IV [Gyrodon lividus]|nr:cytochrome c oxidase polypeptide IV [Gyrodon lividus]